MENIATYGVASMQPVATEARSSGVSWAAVAGGAFVAAAISLILLSLGAGLGLSSVSPWENTGASAATISIATVIWLVLMQIVSASLGGYVAGRLRTKWVNVHTDEVYFRDTAHGFLVWAVATVITASFLTATATSMVSGVAKVGAGAATAAITAGAAGAGSVAARSGNASTSRGGNDANDYFTDMLFRSDKPATSTDGDAATHREVGRIFATSLVKGQLTPADRTYVGQLIAARTGLAQADAEKRVDDVVAQAKAAAEQAKTDAQQAADQARSAAAALSLWIFLALLIGAFCASFSATLGGRQRNDALASV